MIILHFHLQPQYRYELFHINFTSLHCTGRYELNKLTSLPMCGFIAQLVEHRTGIAEVTGSNPVEALIFFRLLLSNCLNWKIYCDDHLSLSVIIIITKIVLPNEDQKTIEVQQASPKHISDFLTQAKNSIYMKKTTEQKWLGAFTTLSTKRRQRNGY